MDGWINGGWMDFGWLNFGWMDGWICEQMSRFSLWLPAARNGAARADVRSGMEVLPAEGGLREKVWKLGCRGLKLRRGAAVGCRRCGAPRPERQQGEDLSALLRLSERETLCFEGTDRYIHARTHSRTNSITRLNIGGEMHYVIASSCPR